MAGGNIKGITIEFRGETTKLDSALKKINTETRSLDKQLRQVDKALKFNPGNVELWRQKQEALNKKLKETREKADLIRETLKKVESGEIEMTAEDVDKLKRELIEADSKAKHFEGELRKIGNAKMHAVGEQFQIVGEKLQSAGEKLRGVSTAGAVATAAIGTLAYKSGKAADELNTLSKVTGIGTGKLQKYSAAADLVDVSVSAIAKSNQKLKKNMYNAANGSKKQAEAFEKLGVSVVDADGNLRDSDDVFTDVIKSLGKMENETERDALAQTLMGKSAAELNPLIEDQGETYEKVSETLKKYDLDFVDDETLQKANDFNDALDTMKMLGKVALQEVGTKLASYLAPVLEKVVGYVGNIVKWVGNLDPKLLAIVGAIGGVLAVLAPLLIGLGKLATGVGAIIKLAGVIAPILGGITLPMLGIAAAIAAVIAIGILLYKNWDKIKAKALEIKQKLAKTWDAIKLKIFTVFNAIKTKVNTVWTGIKTKITSTIAAAKTKVASVVDSMKQKISGAWDAIKTKTSNAWKSIKEKITEPFSKAKETVKGIVDTIKGWFPISLGNLFKGIKTPHFTLEWGEAEVFGKTIKYPKGFKNLGWYAQGGIFNAPTVAGIGEAGPEAVVPLDKFWQKMDAIAEGSGKTYNFYITGDNPREIANEVKRILIADTKKERMAWG